MPLNKSNSDKERKRLNCERSKKWLRENKDKAKNTKLSRTYDITLDQWKVWNRVLYLVFSAVKDRRP